MVEKHLKALVVQHTQHLAPKTHDLEYLAELAGLKLPVEDLDFLTELNGFNLEARYPDEQLKIYKKRPRHWQSDFFRRQRNLPDG